jgi:hypothetical protein
MAPEHCPECLLTPQAEELLQRLEDKLRRTRPGDASWKTSFCRRCGRLSGIFDEREGWSVGESRDRGWSVGETGNRGWTSGGGPIAETKPVSPEPITEERSTGFAEIAQVPLTEASPRIDLDSRPVPPWVTVPEAAFLARVSEQQVLEWIDKGTVMHEVVLRDARHEGHVFVRTRDLDPHLARDAS